MKLQHAVCDSRSGNVRSCSWPCALAYIIDCISLDGDSKATPLTDPVVMAVVFCTRGSLRMHGNRTLHITMPRTLPKSARSVSHIDGMCY